MRKLFPIQLFFILCLLYSCKKDKDEPLPVIHGTVIDVDGNSYKTISVGHQVWMVENLKVTHYNNGDSIPYISGNAEWFKSLKGAYCFYNNDSILGDIYGNLYNWYAVNDTRQICPKNWHVPSYDEWITLTKFLGSNPGYKVFENDSVHWYSPNQFATNSSGLTFLPGGMREWYNDFINLNTHSYYWSSTTESTDDAWYFYLNGGSNINIGSFSTSSGFCIRCIQNQ